MTATRTRNFLLAMRTKASEKTESYHILRSQTIPDHRQCQKNVCAVRLNPASSRLLEIWNASSAIKTYRWTQCAEARVLNVLALLE